MIEIRWFFLVISIREDIIIDKFFMKFKTKTKFELTLFDVEITVLIVSSYESLHRHPLLQ